MSSPSSNNTRAVDLDSVIMTEELERRVGRAADEAGETTLLLSLTSELARSPKYFFQELARSALRLCRADSAGISVLDEWQTSFVWPAVVGQWVHFIGQGTPRDFGPCGTVLDRNSTLLFARPERYFTYLEPVTPAVEEGLLSPFYSDGKAVGTVWAISHRPERKFDMEDKRLLESLCNFATEAYRTLAKIGALEPLRKKVS